MVIKKQGDIKVMKVTVNNAGQIKLQRVFNYNAISFVPLREIVRVIRYLRKDRDFYTLGEVYDEFDRNLTVQEIMDKNPDLSLKSVLYTRAFYKANNQESFLKRKWPVLSALVDENIAIEHSVEGAAEVIGSATHITFEGLRTQKDSKIWAHARFRGFDFILTKDRACKPSRSTIETLDITRCAELRWQRELEKSGGVVNNAIREMPKIIHVPHNMSPVRIKNILRKHQEKIFRINDECASPVIDLTKSNAKPGKHFMEIYRGGSKKQTEKLRDLRVSALMDELGISNLSQDSARELGASLKRAVEHEISVELHAVPGKNNKIVYLSKSTDNFDSRAYQYSGDIDKYREAVRRAETVNPYTIPTHERLKAIRLKGDRALQIA